MTAATNEKAKPGSALAGGQKSLCAVSIGVHVTLAPRPKGEVMA